MIQHRSEVEMHGSTSVSVIMPCHNRAHDLPRVLRAYDQQIIGEPFELIAVDDASDDGTYQVLCAYRPASYRLRPAKQEVNRGPAAARNRALALAQSPLVLFVGDDGWPEPECVGEHLRLHREHPARGVAILGRVAWPDDMACNTLMTHIDGLGAEQFGYHYMHEGQAYDFRHLYTSNVSLKRELLATEKGWFDPEFSYAAFEDAELAYRLVRRGLKIIYSAGPMMRHYHYHTIWTFSERQYRAGKMLSLFNRKHPGVRELGQLHIWLARLRWPAVLLSRWLACLKPSIREAEGWLEAAALDLASFYEWLPNPLLDKLYLGLLRYYLRKGVIDGTLNGRGQAAWVHGVHACYALAPLMSWFIHAAKEDHISLPHGFDNPFRQKLERVSLR